MAILSQIIKATRAVIHDTTDLPSMIACAFRCAPNTRHTKLTTPARRIIKWAIHSTPGMATAQLYAPSLCFGIENSGFNVLICMTLSLHDSLYH